MIETRKQISECFKLLEKVEPMVDFEDLCAIARRNYGIKPNEVQAWSADMQLKEKIKSAYVGSKYFVARKNNVKL